MENETKAPTVTLSNVEENVEVGLAEFAALVREEARQTTLPPQRVAPAFAAPPSNIDPVDLSQARWGILWPPEPLRVEEKAVLEALAPLIEHRARQMGQPVHEFHFQTGWASRHFLFDEGRSVTAGNMRPDVVPYYLCLAASPERIPWDFQESLDGEYAVGRLWFDDVDSCKSYVAHLIAYENEHAKPRPTAPPASPTAHRALLVGPEHARDGATPLSARELVEPLGRWLQDRSRPGSSEPAHNAPPECWVGATEGSSASKSRLTERLRARDTQPLDLLFTAGHGFEARKPGEAQIATQGALVMQEWPGQPFSVQPKHMLAASDVDAALPLRGLAAYCFACYSAGAPREPDWVQRDLLSSQRPLADKPFVARLPQALLSRGTLGFIGHVSRAWEFSFRAPGGAGIQTATFESTFTELLKGAPFGHATDYLNRRCQALTSELMQMEKDNASDEEVANTWLARQDCLGNVVLGDPAARLIG